MMLVLRLLHVLTGAFWFGGVAFSVRFVMPSLGAVGPAAGPVMQQLTQRKLTQTMMGIAIVNVITGIWMMLVLSGGDMGAWMQLNSSKMLSAGGAFAILALLVGMISNPPAAKRLGALSAAIGKRGGPPTPEEAAEMGQLRRRMYRGQVIVLSLLTLAVAAMAVARYT
jgi:uncharacterized membrane protein